MRTKQLNILSPIFAFLLIDMKPGQQRAINEAQHQYSPDSEITPTVKERQASMSNMISAAVLALLMLGKMLFQLILILDNVHTMPANFENIRIFSGNKNFCKRSNDTGSV